jgi:multiple sugar transport system substrate-binding protein
MFARAARGELSPQQSVAQADRQVRAIFDRWRARGLVGG